VTDVSESMRETVVFRSTDRKSWGTCVDLTFSVFSYLFLVSSQESWGTSLKVDKQTRLFIEDQIPGEHLQSQMNEFAAAFDFPVN